METPLQGYFVHIKYRMDSPQSESGLLRRADRVLPPENWHDSLLSKIRDYSIYILASTRICMKHPDCAVVLITN